MADEYVRYVYVADASQVVEANAQVESSARRADAAMLQGNAQVRAAMEANRQAMAQLDLQIAQLTKDKAAMGVEIANIISEVGAESDAYIEQAKDAAVLSAEINELKAQKGELAATNKVLTASMVEEEAAAGASNQQLVRAIVNLDRMGGVSLGAGRAMGQLTAFFSAATMGQIAFVAGAAILIEVISKLIKQQYEYIAVSEAGLKLDIVNAKTQEGHNKIIEDAQHLILGLKSSYEERAKAEKNLADIQAAEITAGKQLQDVHKEDVIVSGSAIGALMGWNTTAQQANETRMKTDEHVRSNIEQLTLLYHTTDVSREAIQKFAERAHFTNEQMQELTAGFNDAAKAAERYNLAVLNGSIAQVDFTKTAKYLYDTVGVVTEGMKAAQLAGMSYDDQIRANSKTLADYSKAIRDHLIELRRLPADVQEAVRRYNELYQNVGALAAAERGMANELDNLRKKQEETAAAADDTTNKFDVQEAKIRAEATRTIEHLKEMYKGYVESRKLNAAELMKLQQEEREAEMIAQTIMFQQLTANNNKRVELMQATEDRIAKIETKADEDTITRGLATIHAQEAIDADALQKAGFARVEAQQYAQRIMLANEAEFWRKIHKIWDEEYAKLPQIVAKTDEEVRRIDEEADRRRLADVIKNLKEIAAVRAALQRDMAARGGQFLPIDDAQLREATAILKELGLTVGEVDKHFGSASRSAQDLLNRVRQLKQESEQGTTAFQKLRDALVGAAVQMGATKTAAQEMQEVTAAALKELESGIVSAFESITSGTATFGEAMKKLTFDLIATIAEKWGEFFIAKGIADIFFDPPLGAAELAAGAALLALAGALKGLASGATSGAGAGSTASAGAAASAGPTASQRAQNPVLVPINASGLQQAPVQLTVSLDRQSGNDFLAGKDVVTGATVAGKHAKAIRQQARNAMKRAS
jgi:hypothetical protein